MPAANDTWPENFLCIIRRAAFQQTVRLRHEDEGTNADMKNPCECIDFDFQNVCYDSQKDSGQDGLCIFFSITHNSFFQCLFPSVYLIRSLSLFCNSPPPTEKSTSPCGCCSVITHHKRDQRGELKQKNRFDLHMCRFFFFFFYSAFLPACLALWVCILYVRMCLCLPPPHVCMWVLRRACVFWGCTM